MAKKKQTLITYSVTLNFKYPPRYAEDTMRMEIKAESAEEAKQTFLGYLTERDMTLNVLVSIDEEFEKKLLAAMKCDDLTTLLAEKTSAADNLIKELRTVLAGADAISPEDIGKLEDKYRALRGYASLKKDEAYGKAIKQCEVLLESIEKFARLT